MRHVYQNKVKHIDLCLLFSLFDHFYDVYRLTPSTERHRKWRSRVKHFILLYQSWFQCKIKWVRLGLSQIHRIQIMIHTYTKLIHTKDNVNHTKMLKLVNRLHVLFTRIYVTPSDVLFRKWNHKLSINCQTSENMIHILKK